MSYTRLLWERKCILFYESGKFSMLSQVLPAESVGFLTPGQHISLFPITKLQTIIQMTIAKKKIFCENAIFVRKERLKRQKIAKSSICFEFQVVVAVVGFKWHRRGNAKNAD